MLPVCRFSLLIPFHTSSSAPIMFLLSAFVPAPRRAPSTDPFPLLNPAICHVSPFENYHQHLCRNIHA